MSEAGNSLTTAAPSVSRATRSLQAHTSLFRQESPVQNRVVTLICRIKAVVSAFSQCRNGEDEDDRVLARKAMTSTALMAFCLVPNNVLLCHRHNQVHREVNKAQSDLMKYVDATVQMFLELKTNSE